MKKPNYHIETIQYLDSNMSWEQQEAKIKPVSIWITGFKIDETDEYVTMASEVVAYEDHDEFRNQVSIPKSSIITSEN